MTGQPLSVLTNNGLLRKTAGTGTSVVDATYAGSGQVAVQSGTLALPGQPAGRRVGLARDDARHRTLRRRRRRL